MIKIYSRFLSCCCWFAFCFYWLFPTKGKDPEWMLRLRDELSEIQSDGQDVAESDTSESEADGDVEDSSMWAMVPKVRRLLMTEKVMSFKMRLAQGSEEDDLAQETEVGEARSSRFTRRAAGRGVAENGMHQLRKKLIRI